MGEKIQIMLNSKTANYYNNGTTDCVFMFPKPQLKKNHRAYISVIDAVIPYSFYNVNDTNSAFEYTLNGVDYAMTIAKANYNVNTLISYFLLYTTVWSVYGFSSATVQDIVLFRGEGDALF